MIFNNHHHHHLLHHRHHHLLNRVASSHKSIHLHLFEKYVLYKKFHTIITLYEMYVTTHVLAAFVRTCYYMFFTHHIITLPLPTFFSMVITKNIV